MDNLFEMPTPAAKPSKPKPLNRLEYYNNGPDCKWPVTQYGLLWDVNNSTKRTNLNFGLVDIDWVADNFDNPALYTADHINMQAVAQKYVDISTDSEGNLDKTLLVTFGKRNALSGTGAHNLRVGIKDFDYSVAAIMRVNPGMEPDVWLYDNGQWITLTQGWKGCAHSSHPAKLWQVKW